MMQGLRRWVQLWGIEAVVLSVLFVIFLLGTVGYAAYGFFYESNYTENETAMEIYIPGYININSVATILEEYGVYPASRFIYKVERFTDWDPYLHRIRGGTYEIPPEIHVKELIRLLENGPKIPLKES